MVRIMFCQTGKTNKSRKSSHQSSQANNAADVSSLNTSSHSNNNQAGVVVATAPIGTAASSASSNKHGSNNVHHNSSANPMSATANTTSSNSTNLAAHNNHAHNQHLSHSHSHGLNHLVTHNSATSNSNNNNNANTNHNTVTVSTHTTAKQDAHNNHHSLLHNFEKQQHHNQQHQQHQHQQHQHQQHQQQQQHAQQNLVHSHHNSNQVQTTQQHAQQQQQHHHHQQQHQQQQPQQAQHHHHHQQQHHHHHQQQHQQQQLLHPQQHPAGITCRYVTSEFHAAAEDEITVYPGDFVLVEFTDTNSLGNWSHVLRLKSHQRGFVPSEILSMEPRRNSQFKKKLPRSNVDPSEHHGTHLLLGSSDQHGLEQAPSTDESCRLRHRPVGDHNPRHFCLSHSLQGSSGGKQSVHKFPTNHPLSHHHQFSTPGYYNVREAEQLYERFEMDCKPFLRERLGLYMVTHNFVAREENDIEVHAGDCVTLLNRDDDDWFWVSRNYDLAEGFVPARFICDYDQVRSILEKGNSTCTMKSMNQHDFHTYINHRPERSSLPTDQQSSTFQ